MTYCIHNISNSGNCEILKVLLVKGADVDSSSDCGTPLHIAAVKSHDGCMKILLDHHADVKLSYMIFFPSLLLTFERFII